MRVGRNLDFSKTNAHRIKKNVENAVKDVINMDNLDNVDLNSHRGEVEISSRRLKAMGLMKPDTPNAGYIRKARVSFNPETNNIKNASIKSEEYNSPVHPTKVRYSIKEDGNSIYYKEEKRAIYWGPGCSATVKVDKGSGEITDYREREDAMTLGRALVHSAVNLPVNLLGMTLGTGIGSLFGPAGSTVGMVAGGALSFGGLTYFYHKSGTFF